MMMCIVMGRQATQASANIFPHANSFVIGTAVINTHKNVSVSVGTVRVASPYSATFREC